AAVVIRHAAGSVRADHLGRREGGFVGQHVVEQRPQLRGDQELIEHRDRDVSLPVERHRHSQEVRGKSYAMIERYTSRSPYGVPVLVSVGSIGMRSYSRITTR